MLLAAALALCLQEESLHSEWESWKGFGPGSSVTHSQPSLKMLYTRTLKTKEESKLVFAVLERAENARGIEKEEVVEKPQAKPPAEKKCDRCGAAGGHVKETRKNEKVKFKDKELDCILVEHDMTDCAGKRLGLSKTWYCKSVPGWFVKMDHEWRGMVTKMELADYTVRK